MITEDYVSFETAKLLKEKGFREICNKCYGIESKIFFSSIRSNDDDIMYAAPTLQMAMKWLREVHHIVITTDYANICGIGFTYIASVIKINDNHAIEEGPGLNACVYGTSYEEACKAAIKYCLENDLDMDKNLALETLKSFVENTDNVIAKDAILALHPELAENENENLKNKSGYFKAGKFWKASTLWNATKDKIPQRVPNRYILQKCTWNIGTLQQFADEVKNVQEVGLDYPIILDINGNILDGAHRVVKAYLEGKDIDVVYLGEDEWPEPDYDEEKAVKESEDERVRKEIYNFLIDMECKKEWITYLEKQKEQSTLNFYVPEGADMNSTKNKIAVILGQYKSQGFIEDEEYYSMLKYIGEKEQKPTEWSEEDEKIMIRIIGLLKGYLNSNSLYAEEAKECIDWLKFIRPQPHWKPSEEQMNYLCAEVNEAKRKHNISVSGYPPARILESLYNDLSKL